MNKEKILKKIKNNDWRFWLERIYHPFIASMNFSGISEKYFDKVGLTGFGYNVNLYQFPDVYQSRSLSFKNQRKYEDFLRGKSIFDISDALKRSHANNMRLLKNIIKSDKNIFEKVAEVRDIFKSYMPFLWIIEPMEFYYEKKINDVASKYIKENIKEWTAKVSVPNKKNAYVLMQEELLKSPVKKVLDKYFWLKSRDGFSDFYTYEELEKIKKQIKKPAKHKINIPVGLKPLVRELKEFTFLRTDRTDKYYEAMGRARPILQELAKHIKVSFEELALYDVDSILNGKPKKFNLPFTYIFCDGQQFLFQDKIIEFEVNKSQLITGTNAYNGLVRGVVKIIKHPSELGKIKDGEVLVAQSTFPSFISAMYKACAFVTDEGGITSHAAIIAREMKKPCIIGTKIATKVLKDGDLVEVDADNGVVKIIK